MLKIIAIKIAVMALIWLPILFFSPDPDGFNVWTLSATILSVPVIGWEFFAGMWQKIFKNRKTR
jgi:hypothetical protein